MKIQQLAFACHVLLLKFFMILIFIFNLILCLTVTSVCRVHQRLIQSGFSHVFDFYSEPIEIVCYFCMPSPSAPDPLRVQSCVCCLF